MYYQATKGKTYHKSHGISFAGKAFSDISQAVVSKHRLEYPHNKMLGPDKRSKAIVDDQSTYLDWYARDDIKAGLQVDIIPLMDEFDFLPVTINDVYKEVLEQAENYKKNASTFTCLSYERTEEKVIAAAEKEYNYGTKTDS